MNDEKKQQNDEEERLRVARELLEGDKQKRRQKFAEILQNGAAMFGCELRAVVIIGGVEQRVPIEIVAK